MSDGFATFIRCRHPETDMQTSRLPLWDIIIRIKKNIGDTDIRKPTRSKIESIHQAQWKSDGMYKTVMQTSEMQTKLAKLQVPEIFSSLKLFDNFFSKIDYLWDIFIRIKKKIGDADIHTPTRSKIESIHQAQWKSDGMYKTVMQTSEIQTKLAKLQVPEMFFQPKIIR